jgi:hypothetical protein
VSLITQPYTAEDPDRTKPSIVLFDWTGDDEETVRWDVASGERPGETDLEPLPERWRGIGPRPGSIALGVVMGVSLAIGALALVLPQDAPASPLPPASAPLTSPAWDGPSSAVPETTLVSVPVSETPRATTNYGTSMRQPFSHRRSTPVRSPASHASP